VYRTAVDEAAVVTLVADVVLPLVFDPLDDAVDVAFDAPLVVCGVLDVDVAVEDCVLREALVLANDKGRRRSPANSSSTPRLERRSFQQSSWSSR